MSSHRFVVRERAVLRTALLLGSAVGSLVIIGGPPPARAQAVASNGGQIEEVVVTAQKRVQRLEDVPVAVTVLNQLRLEQANVQSVKDMFILTPGLNGTTNAAESTTTVRIRGIGSVADNAGLEDAVGIYIDGVYRPRNGVGFNDLGELSDVEILKGPQGTLFGKNTVGGVIQISTLAPSFTGGGVTQVDIQNYSGRGASTYVTGPLSDTLAASFFVAGRMRDGYLPVVQSPDTHIPAQNDEHVYTFRGQLLYEPSDQVKIRIIGDYAKRDDHCCVAVDFLNGFPAILQNTFFPGTVPNPVSKTNLTAFLNEGDEEHIQDAGISAQVDWSTPWLNNAVLTSITAYRDWRDHGGGDTDATLADILDTPGTASTEFKQFSEEVRYTGEAGPVVWQVGAFYTHEELDVGAPLVNGTLLGPYLDILTAGNGPFAAFTYNPPGGAYPVGEGTFDQYHQIEHSISFYTQDDFKVTDALTLTAGLRFTDEHKSLATLYNNNDTSGTCAHFEGIATGLGLPLTKAVLGTDCFINPAFKGLQTSQSFDQPAVTGTAKAVYRFTDDAMVYASYSRGNLVGGFNLAEVTTPVGNNPNASLTPQVNTQFPAEYVNAYELGSKVQLFDKRLLLTGAAFYQAYKNFQLNAFTGTQFVEATIPQAISRGAEIQGYFNATEDLTLNLGITYADTYYPDSAENQAALGNKNPASPLFQATPLFRLPGSNLSYAPLWSIAPGIFYRHDLFEGFRGTFNVDAKYQSSYNTGSDHDPVKLQKGYTLFNARIGIGPDDELWSLEFWSTNLFDKRYKQTAYDGVFQTFSAPQPSSISALNNYDYFPGQPRFFGVTLRLKY
jgi:outer membrane receptor protein involved in Fe transport